MPEETKPTSTPEDLELPREECDWFLRMLVDFVNDGIGTFDITLQMSGFLVSGILIRGDTYFEGFAEAFSSGLADAETAEKVRTSLSQLGNEYKPKPNDEEENTALATGYIHLKDARFFNNSGKPIPPNGGLLWRGRLSEVSGFVLGSLRN